MPRKKTHEEFVSEVYNLVDDEYVFLEEYVNDKHKIKVIHKICNNEYYVSPHDFLSKRRCRKCQKNKKTKTNEEFKKQIFELTGNEYTFLEEYINSNTKIRVRHNSDKCKRYEYDVTPNKFISAKRRCPKCKGGVKKNHEEFIRNIFDLVQSEYSVLEEYKSALLKIPIRHNKCGYEWRTRPNDFLNGNRCPKCNESKGEKVISKWLDDNGIKYHPQYKFDNCRDKRVLLFDFATFDKNNKLSYLIEFDGRQHFEIVEHLGGEKEFKATQKRDKIKNDYCTENNIPLLRIPYWDFDNIEQILEVFHKSIHPSEQLTWDL